MRLSVNFMQIEVKSSDIEQNERYALLIRHAINQMDEADQLFKTNLTEMLVNMSNLMGYETSLLKSLLVEHFDADEDLFDEYSKNNVFSLCLTSIENEKIIDALINVGRLFDEWSLTVGFGHDFYRN